MLSIKERRAVDDFILHCYLRNYLGESCLAEAILVRCAGGSLKEWRVD